MRISNPTDIKLEYQRRDMAVAARFTAHVRHIFGSQCTVKRAGKAEAMTLLRRVYTYAWQQWQIRHDPIQFARSLGVTIGNDCRLLCLKTNTFGSEPYLVRLGNHVTVTGGVRFVTHDGGVWVFREMHPDIDAFAPIIVGDNVFIGLNAVILPGVSIGDNSVVGACSVVTRDVAPRTIVAGSPARPIKSLDDYWLGVQDRIFHVRHLPQDEKRQLLQQEFRGSCRAPTGGVRR